MTVLVPAENASPADWIVEALTTFAESVTSLLPSGFEAYVRVCHPAARDGKPLRWSEIAAEHGRVAHAGMQLGGITGSGAAEGHKSTEFWDWPPHEGTLPPEVSDALNGVLPRHTRTSERCCFAVWDGFPDLPPDLRRAPTFAVPKRRYHLLAGPAVAGGESVSNSLRQQTANLWWPDEHAWCVATEIDLRSTYIGCSQSCAGELLTLAELEAYAIDPATGISWASDTVNPEPARG